MIPAMTKLKKGWFCEQCEAYVEVPASAPPPLPAGDGLESMPFPFAFPLSYARDGSLGVTERLNNTLFAAYQGMRTAGLLMLADYLACEASDRALETAIRGLRMPHWGEWTQLCDKLVAFWQGKAEGKPERASRFPSLVEGWAAVGREKSALAATLPGMQAGPARNINDALWKLRNDRAHRMATHTPERAEEEEKLGKALPLVEEMGRRLFGAGDFQLLRRVSRDGEPLKVVRVHGPHRDMRFESEPLEEVWAGLFDQTGVACIAAGEGVPVYPLLVPDEGEGGRPSEAVTLVDGVKLKRLVLLGVRSHGESELHLGPLTEALARKKVEFGLGREETKRWTLAEWARTLAKEEVSQLRGRKYFPECYVERGGVDVAAGAALERGGKALLLLGEAGSGKSSLLTRLVDRLANTEPESAAETKTKKSGLDAYLSARGGGDVVLYLTGRGAYSADAGTSGSQALVDAVCRKAGVRAGTFRDMEELCAKLEESTAADSDKTRRVWVVLDALNEADRFVDLLKAFDDFLPAVAKYPWLRVVVSLRSGAYSALEKRHEDMAQHGGVLANEAHLFKFLDEKAKKDVPYLDVRAFDEKREGPEAYRLRAEAFPDSSCKARWDSLTSEVQGLLCNPLHLHLFHVTYAGRDAASDVDESTLLGAYLERLCEELPALRQTLEAIGRYMAENATPALAADVADTWVSEWRKRQGFDSAACVVKLDPVEELVSASVLLRPSQEGFGKDRKLVSFTFSHQRLCEQVLLRELRRQVLPQTQFTAEDYVRFAAYGEEREAFVEYVGALRAAVTQDVRSGRAEVVASLLDIPADKTRAKLIESAVKTVLRTWGPTEEGTPAARKVMDGFNQRAGQTEDARQRWLNEGNFGDWASKRGATWGAFNLSQRRVARVNRAEEASLADWKKAAAELSEYGNLLLVLGRTEEAQGYYEEGLKLARRLYEAEPGRADYTRDLSIGFNKLGDVAQVAGRTEEAQGYYEEGLKLARRMYESEPGRADYTRDLFVSFNKLGDVAQVAGRTEEALGYYEEGLKL
ncbi:MAG: hypothetical protein RL653_2549, partial [Pseudomonadota bacterium]